MMEKWPNMCLGYSFIHGTVRNLHPPRLYGHMACKAAPTLRFQAWHLNPENGQKMPMSGPDGRIFGINIHLSVIFPIIPHIYPQFHKKSMNSASYARISKKCQKNQYFVKKLTCWDSIHKRIRGHDGPGCLILAALRAWSVRMLDFIASRVHHMAHTPRIRGGYGSVWVWHYQNNLA